MGHTGQSPTAKNDETKTDPKPDVTSFSFCCCRASVRGAEEPELNLEIGKYRRTGGCWPDNTEAGPDNTGAGPNHNAGGCWT